MKKDILPYIALQSALQGIMLSHICFAQVDTLPCSMSKKWVNIIANDLDINSLIITDCMSMSAVKDLFDDPESMGKFDMVYVGAEAKSIEEITIFNTFYKSFSYVLNHNIHKFKSKWNSRFKNMVE